MDEKTIKRFWSKVLIKDENDCREWQAGKRNGYGTFSVDGRTCGAHRVSWKIHNGAIPQGKHICHHCDNPACVNPNHLFQGNHTDNMQDMVKKGRWRTREGITARSSYTRLTQEERREIALKWLSEGLSKNDVCRHLGIHHKTLAKDIA